MRFVTKQKQPDPEVVLELTPFAGTVDVIAICAANAQAIGNFRDGCFDRYELDPEISKHMGLTLDASGRIEVR